MARYSHKGHDIIRYDITQNIAIRYNTYDTIRKCFTVCKNRKQAGNSAHHWSTVVLPINTVAAAGAWILAVRRGDGRGRPARRRSAGGRCSLKSRVIQQSYGEYWPPNNSSCGDSPQLLLFGGHTALRFGGRTAGGQSHGSNI